MKREDLIKAKLDEKQRVDFTEIHEDDKHSIKRLQDEEEDKLRQVKKRIKRTLENHTISLGSEFIAMIKERNTITKEIAFIKEVNKEFLSDDV